MQNCVISFPVDLLLPWPGQHCTSNRFQQLAAGHFLPIFAALFFFYREGKNVIATGRAMMGKTNPLESAPGTIRGDFGIDTGRNVIHGSSDAADAKRELGSACFRFRFRFFSITSHFISISHNCLSRILV